MLRGLRRVVCGLVGMMTAVGGLALGATAAFATGLTCGQTITQNTTLASDLGPCPGSSVVIGADDITLDLGGHTIQGQVDFGSHRGVTVRNGTLQGSQSTQIPGSGNRLILLTIRDESVFGGSDHSGLIAFNQLSDATLLLGSSTEVAFNSNLGGSEIFVGANDRIEHNQGLFVQGFEGHGGFDSAQNTVIANNDTPGISVGLTGGTIENNVVHGSVNLGQSANAVIRNNLVVGGTITLSGVRSSLVWKNVVSQSPGNGIEINPGFCLQVGANLCNDTGSSTNDVILGNTVQNDQGDGVFIAAPISPFGIDEGPTNILIRHNRARRNGGDGIHTNTPTTTLANNRANFNTALGIEAIPGATDGGSNHAIGNGNPLQCTPNITCR